MFTHWYVDTCVLCSFFTSCHDVDIYMYFSLPCPTMRNINLVRVERKIAIRGISTESPLAPKSRDQIFENPLPFPAICLWTIHPVSRCFMQIVNLSSLLILLSLPFGFFTECQRPASAS